MAGQDAEREGQEKADVEAIEGEEIEMLPIFLHQRLGGLGIGIHVEYEVDQVLHQVVAGVLRVRREADPGHETRDGARDDPSQIERRVPRVEQPMGVIVMAPRLALPAILGALVFIFVPARLVEHMRTFDHDLVAFLKRRFAIIARLIHDHPVIGEPFRVADDVFPLENSVAHGRHDELEDQVERPDDEKTHQAALQDNLRRRQPVHDDGIVNAPQIIAYLVRPDEPVAVVGVQPQLVLEAAIDLQVGVDEGEFVIGEIHDELAQDAVQDGVLVVRFEIITSRLLAKEAQEGFRLLVGPGPLVGVVGAIAVVEGAEVDVKDRDPRRRVAMLDDGPLKREVLGVYGLVVIVNFPVREDDQDILPGRQSPGDRILGHLREVGRFLPPQLVVLGQEGAVKILLTRVGFKILVQDVIARVQGF